MKKTGWLLTVLVVLLAGTLIFAGVFYLEETERQQEETAKKQQEEADKRRQEASGEKQRQEEKKNTPAQEEPFMPETAESPGENEKPQEDEDTVLVFAGDVYISPHVTANYDAGGISNVVSKELLDKMAQADLCMVNEEFPFGTVGEPMEDKQYTFRVEPSYVSVLTDMGVDVVSLANNHVLDYGLECLEETFQTLKQAGIDYVGAGSTKEEAASLKTYEFNGRTYGILSASRVIPVAEWNIENRQPGVFATYDETALVNAIKAARETCDFLAVYVHWGVERTTQLEEHQKYLAHAYVDAGADLVLGAHPHILQGIENYNGKLIFYSLGNYIFNQNIDKTMLVEVRLKDGEPQVSLVPGYAAGAKTCGYEDREEFFAYLESLSQGVHITDGVITLN